VSVNINSNFKLYYDGVYNLLANLGATGSDDIPSKFLKEFVHKIAPV